jgi:stage V sporulation protein G
MKAGGSVTFDDCFVVHGIRVLEVNGKTFVTMPQTKRKEEFKDICHPITTKFRNYIATEVLKVYEKIKE